MMMQRAYAFDPVHDTQRVFRALLQAFANPGRIVRADREAARLPGPLGAHLAVACALVDSAVGYCVLDCPELDEQITQWTFGRRCVLQEGDFLFITQDCDDELIATVLEEACTGTLEEPHRGATIVVRVQSLAGAGVVLTGPGIDGEITAPLEPSAARWLIQRRNAAIEYPRGVDLLFVSGEGAMLATPRLVHIK